MSAGKVWVVVHLGDGSAAKIPRRWTDADGTTQCVELGGNSKFSLIGLRELLKLVDALGGRRFASNDECGEINAPHHLEGDIDAQANVARVHRAGGVGGAVGGFPEQARSEVTELYARLMAQILAERVISVKEVCDESKPR